MPRDAEIRTSLRMERSLHDHLVAAAKSNRRNFSEEVRHRLVDSFGTSGVVGAPLDAPTQDLLYGIGEIAAEVAVSYPRWYEDPFAFRVMARAIVLFMRRWMPKGEPVHNPKPGSRAAEGFYGKRATVDSVAAGLASSAWALADHLEMYPR